jgi:hypothetical protein
MNQPHPLTTPDRALRDTTRRHFFGQCAMGVGTLALSQLLAENGQAAVPTPSRRARRNSP